jgi:hypothetical protein
MAAVLAALLLAAAVCGQQAPPAAIDWNYARQLAGKVQSGQPLTDEERAYLTRAQQELRAGRGPQSANANAARPPSSQPTTQSTGMIPLCQMIAGDSYKGQDGGLYGGGRNTPPPAQQAAAEAAAGKIVPLDPAGNPAKDGKIGMISMGISNTTMEFSLFKRIADADAAKNPSLVIVDCAQGGRDALRWSNDQDPTWNTAFDRIAAAGITPQQVQAAWIKLVIAGPQRLGDFPVHARELQKKMVEVLHLARQRFPNLRLAFLSSRIYAGYAAPTAGSPEPYAYETAFAMRWLIQDQVQGVAALNADPAKGAVQAPVLLWGPYFWADGVVPRQGDGLVWKREDLRATDGMHPSDLGRNKVARMLLDFFKSDPYAKGWFVKPGPAAGAPPVMP